MSTLRDRWRSRRHVGAAKPAQEVWLRKGHLRHDYIPFVKLDGTREDFGEVAKSKHNHAPWHPHWVNDGDWIQVPNVLSVELEEELAEDGFSDPETCTIRIENIMYEATTGIVGVYHKIRNGWLAPLFGFQPHGRPRDPAATQNEWFSILNGGCRVKILQGYGDAIEETFTGLIDDSDVHDTPHQITVTCRGFGQLLTDQRLLGSAKGADIKMPIVFCDRQIAHKREKVGVGAKASSQNSSHPAKGVLKPGDKEYWLSGGHDAPSNTEWVEVHLPKGKYQDAYLWPLFAGMEGYLSLYARSDDTHSCHWDGAAIDDGWVDIGAGSVPGAFGGIPYVKHYKSLNAEGHYHAFGHELRCGHGSIIRFSFRKLHHNKSTDDYRAKVARLFGVKRVDETKIPHKHWVLVDDAADVVKWALMWAGFREWNIEPFKVRLKHPITFHQGQFLSDIVKQMLGDADFVFFLDKPTDHDLSFGVPTFRRSHALLSSAKVVEEVRGTDLLTGIETKFTKEPLAYAIRARGMHASKAKGGLVFGEDNFRRFQATYWPPWSDRHRNLFTGLRDTVQHGRLSGVVKHTHHYDDNLQSEDECMMACVLIALKQALVSYGGTIEIPGYPGFSLDAQMAILDTASGTNTRMWVSHRSSSFTEGEQGAWTMSLQGSMLDTPDIETVVVDYYSLLARVLQEYAV